MATAIQRRRGTTAQTANFTGLAGEITIDTDLNTIIVHDGSTAGGYRLAKYTEVQSAASGDISSIVAGSGLTGGATSGDATVNVGAGNGITVNADDVAVNVAYFDVTAGGTGFGANLEPSANNTYSLGSSSNVWKDVFVGPGSLYVNGQQVISDNSGTIQISADAGQNISIVTSGAGSVELTSGSGVIEMKSNVQLTSGKTISTAGGGATQQGGNIDMDSNSINNLDDPVQNQDAATKAYVDTQLATKDQLSELSGDSDDITEGSTNLFYTDARARASLSVTNSGDGSIAYNDSTGVIAYTGPNQAEANTKIENYISVTDAGGDGSLAYSSGAFTYTGPSQAEANSRIDAYISVTDAGGDGSLTLSSGEFTYTGPSAAEVRAHFTAGDGLDVSSGEFAVDSSVVRTTGAQTVAGAKTFSDDAIFSGNLTVNGTQTILNTETLTVDDNIIILNNNASGAPSQNAGIQVNRGSSADVTLQYNETGDRWQFTNDGSTFYNLIEDSDDITEGSTNVFYTDALARAAISVSGDLAYNSGTGVISFTERTDSEVRGLFSGGTGITYNSSTGAISLTDTGYVTGVTAGAGLTGGGEDGTVTLNAVAGYGITVNANDIEVANSDIRGLFSASGDISYNSTTGVFSFTNDAGDIEGVTAGTGLSGGGTSGTVTLNVSGLTVSEFAADSIQLGSESFSDSDTVIMTAAAVQDKIESYGYSTTTGDITAVTAGTGLSGGGTSGGVTLNLATSGVTAGTYGDSDSVAQVVVDAYGRVTAVSEVNIGIAAGAVSGLATSATTDTTSASNISSGTLASARLPDLTVADFAAAAIQTGAESFSDSDSILMTAAAVQDKIESYGYSTTTGDITGVTAGSGLTGGGSSGGVTVNVGAGSYITVAADTVSVDATSTNTASKVVARDSSGNFAAGTITATATQAQYADLAEKYEADEELEAGTVVCFGGEKEITACDVEGHHAVAGVISTDPAHLMNNDCPGIALPVALAGRVPCKVVGPVAKGDLMIASSVKGHAKADNDAPAGRIIGKAIGSNEDGEGVVEVLVNMM